MKTAYTDGACRGGNPGVCSCGWILYLGDPPVTFSKGYYLGPELHSNNFAEFSGLLRLLEYLYLHKVENVTIFCDSLLVVNTVMDVWDLSEPTLLPLWRKAYGLRVAGHHTVKHVKGHSGVEGNEAVDKLCNEVLDEKQA
jgi:ribonuclease HI